MPFHYFILNFAQTSRKPFLRVWNNAISQEASIFEEKVSIAQEPVQAPAKIFNNSRLTELSLIVDTQGAYGGENRPSETMKKIKAELEIK